MPEIRSLLKSGAAPTILQAVEDAQDAKTAATAAAERAEDARDAAQLAQANAELAETGAEAARDAALLSRGVFASTALGLSNGVAAVTVTGAGSGGANGVFALAFSGGAGTGAAGTFTVASGAVVSVTITNPGTGYTSAPTVSFAASAGLTGVTATVAIAPRNPVGTYFSVPGSGDDSLILYRVDAGPVAVEVTRYPSTQRIARNEVTRHGAPINRSLVRTGEGAYILNPELDPMGQDDGRGTLFDRAITRHGAPISDDLVQISASEFRRFVAPVTSAVAWVEDGEGWMALGDNAWPMSDGASDGGPSVLAMDVRAETLMVRRLPYSEYASRPVRSARFPAGDWPFASNIRRVVAICYHGQSQAVGTNFLTLNDMPLDAGRAAMFARGPRLTRFDLYAAQEDAEDYVADGAVFAGLVDLAEMPAVGGLGESPMTTLCSKILANLPADTGVIAINAAVGGQPIENLVRGKASWHNMAVALGEARRMCAARAVTFEIGALFWSQGGSNSNDSPEVYAGKFTDGIYDPWNALMQDHGYAAHEVPVFVNGMTHSTANNMAVARSALLLHDDATRNIIAVGPEYLFTSCNDEGLGTGGTSYTTHISAEGTIHRADFEARAYKAVVIDGGAWHPLRMTAALRVGPLVTVSLNLGAANVTGPPIINSAAIASVANAGFSWIDNGDGNAVTITGVAVSGGGEIEITLSDTPTGTGQKIGYALSATAVTANWQGPINGARGAVADSAPGSLTINGKSYSPRLHLHTDIINVGV